MEFCAGFTGIILSQLPPSMASSTTAHQLMHLNRIMSYAVDSPWLSILNFNAAFFRSIEQRQSSWENWEKIQIWHSRHLESLKLSANNNNKLVKDDGKDEKSEDTILGVRVGFMRQSKLCFKFQSEVCDLESGQISCHGVPLAHLCGFCLEKSGRVADPSTKSCPEQAKGFGRGGGCGGSSI